MLSCLWINHKRVVLESIINLDTFVLVHITVQSTRSYTAFTDIYLYAYACTDIIQYY